MLLVIAGSHRQAENHMRERGIPVWKYIATPRSFFGMSPEKCEFTCVGTWYEDSGKWQLRKEMLTRGFPEQNDT